MPLPSRMGRHVQGLLLMIATSELAMGRVRVAGHPGCLTDDLSIGVFRRLAQAGNVSDGLLHPRDAPDALSMGESGTIARGKRRWCWLRRRRRLPIAVLKRRSPKLQSVFANCNSDEGG